MDEDNIIELIGEDGTPIQFEHLCTIPYNDDEYIVLADVNSADEEEQEVVILRIVPKDDGDEYDGDIEEDVLDAVFERFLELTEELEEEDE